MEIFISITTWASALIRPDVNLSIGGSTKAALKSNGDFYFNNNVGIGTDTPGYKLEVEGTVKAIAFKGNLDGNFNNNVGIGTDTPGYKLDVVGNIRIGDAIPSGTGPHLLRISGNAGSTAAQIWATGSYYGINVTTVHRSGGYYVAKFVGSGGKGLTVWDNGDCEVIKGGKLGIGTRNPIGSITIGEGYTGAPKNEDNMLIIGRSNGASSIVMTRWMGMTIDSTFHLSFGDCGVGTSAKTTLDKSAFRIQYLAPDNTLVLNSSGNVGIGTDKPVAKLDVVGKMRIGDAIPSGTCPWRLRILGSGGSSAQIYATGGYYGINVTTVHRSGGYYVARFVGSGGKGLTVWDDGGVEIIGSRRRAWSGSYFQYPFPMFLPWGADGLGSDVGLQVTKGIVADWIGSQSDRRIKKNIEDIDDGDALKILRKIPVRYYNYIDEVSKGNRKVVGFIAQEVKEHFPCAISFSPYNTAIPNIFKKITNELWEEKINDLSKNDLSKNEFILTNFDVVDSSGVISSIDISGGSTYKFFISDTDSEEEEKEVLADASGNFVFDKKWENLYLYGICVKDFHIVDKAKIFAVGFSATQEIDRIQQSEKAKLEEQTSKLEEQTSKLEEQTSKLEEQTSKLAAAEAKITELEAENTSLKSRLDTFEARLTAAGI